MVAWVFILLVLWGGVNAVPPPPNCPVATYQDQFQLNTAPNSSTGTAFWSGSTFWGSNMLTYDNSTGIKTNNTIPKIWVLGGNIFPQRDSIGGIGNLAISPLDISFIFITIQRDVIPLPGNITAVWKDATFNFYNAFSIRLGASEVSGPNSVNCQFTVPVGQSPSFQLRVTNFVEVPPVPFQGCTINNGYDQTLFCSVNGGFTYANPDLSIANGIVLSVPHTVSIHLRIPVVTACPLMTDVKIESQLTNAVVSLNYYNCSTLLGTTTAALTTATISAASVGGFAGPGVATTTYSTTGDAFASTLGFTATSTSAVTTSTTAATTAATVAATTTNQASTAGATTSTVAATTGATSTLSALGSTGTTSTIAASTTSAGATTTTTAASSTIAASTSVGAATVGSTTAAAAVTTSTSTSTSSTSTTGSSNTGSSSTSNKIVAGVIIAVIVFVGGIVLFFVFSNSLAADAGGDDEDEGADTKASAPLLPAQKRRSAPTPTQYPQPTIADFNRHPQRVYVHQ